MGNLKPTDQQSADQETIPRLFYVLVGSWNMVGTHPLLPEGVRGRATFNWLEDGAALLVMHSDPEQPGVPRSTSVIGRDDTEGSYCMLYTDERGVSRVYQVRFEGSVWKMWREAPAFSQRFTGTLSDDEKVITSLWETSSDGVHWENDLELTYTRIR